MHRIIFLILTASILLSVPTFSGDISKAYIYDIPDKDLAKTFDIVPGSKLTPTERMEMASYRFDADTLKILVILLHWIDRPGTYPSETFDTLFFSHGIYSTGSIADYFEEVSFGQVAVAGDIIPWYSGGFYTEGWGMEEFENVLYDLDGLVDYSQYDGNNDGLVDAVIFLRSGNGQEDSGDSNDIWSYAVSYHPDYSPGPYDGVMIPRWCTAPETMPLRNPDNPRLFSGVDSLNSISVAAHELTHNLGLPDLYDYDSKLDTNTYFTPGDDNDHPMMDWCLMGYNGYGIFSIKKIVPPHLCGWMKLQMDWINPIVLGDGVYNDLVVYNVETTPDSSLYMVPINLADGEYFLLEYRNPSSGALFDKFDSDFSVYFWPDLTFGSEPLDRGLIITHIHDSLGAYWHRINSGTPDYPHYTVALEDAGYNPQQDAYSNPEGFVTDSAHWWYPYETRKAGAFSPGVTGQTDFGPATIPNSDGYYGPTNIYIRVDSIVDNKMYIYVDNSNDADNDGIPAYLDNCPEDYNPGQDDDDIDNVGNVCDNCVNTYNPEQADTDGDDVGDICDNCIEDPNTDQSDIDNDTVGDVCDNCPEDYNPNQVDICTYNCGDANIDDDVNILDISFLIAYLYMGGDSPESEWAADPNGDGNINILDINYLIAYLYMGGPEPVCQ